MSEINLAEINGAMNKVSHELANYLESSSSLWNTYVDPREAYMVDGELWEGIGVGVSPLEELPYRTLEELWNIQSITRVLSRSNEFCINGHKNRINYIVGKAHKYRIVGIDEDTPNDTIERVQQVIDRILKENKWKRRQKETKLRDDRDGETFIRKFRPVDGIMRFRFIEPRDIPVPPNPGPNESYGIRTSTKDIETIEAYYVNGEGSNGNADWVDASTIQHRKWNVDSSLKRGYPLFYPVRKNLVRAVKLLRNMSVATEIQTAIAMIRKHAQASQQAVKNFVQLQAEQRKKQSGAKYAGETENVLDYNEGSIIDAPAGTDYDIPKQLDPSKTVSALQAELRAIAAHLVMPEFMLTSDASNANFSSTMVAEGPAVKNFESEQDTQMEYDLELLEEALQFAADSGLLGSEDIAATKIEASGPTVQVRDKLQEAQIRQIHMGLDILSPQTASNDAGLDYNQEQINKEKNREATGGLPFGKVE